MFFSVDACTVYQQRLLKQQEIISWSDFCLRKKQIIPSGGIHTNLKGVFTVTGMITSHKVDLTVM